MGNSGTSSMRRQRSENRQLTNFTQQPLDEPLHMNRHGIPQSTSYHWNWVHLTGYSTRQTTAIAEHTSTSSTHTGLCARLLNTGTQTHSPDEHMKQTRAAGSMTTRRGALGTSNGLQSDVCYVCREESMARQCCDGTCPYCCCCW
eukprot:scpid73981/ scgid28395/ 